MDMALWHKFTQHYDLKEELLSTGSAELVEVRTSTSLFYTRFDVVASRTPIRIHFGA